MSRPIKVIPIPLEDCDEILDRLFAGEQEFYRFMAIAVSYFSDKYSGLSIAAHYAHSFLERFGAGMAAAKFDSVKSFVVRDIECHHDAIAEPMIHAAMICKPSYKNRGRVYFKERDFIIALTEILPPKGAMQ